LAGLRRCSRKIFISPDLKINYKEERAREGEREGESEREREGERG
jgi:hypothetical protein